MKHATQETRYPGNASPRKLPCTVGREKKSNFNLPHRPIKQHHIPYIHFLFRKLRCNSGDEIKWAMYSSFSGRIPPTKLICVGYGVRLGGSTEPADLQEATWPPTRAYPGLVHTYGIQPERLPHPTVVPGVIILNNVCSFTPKLGCRTFKMFMRFPPQ